MKNPLLLAACLAALAAFTVPLHADVKVPAVFAEHMVLQRDVPVPVWGWAQPGEQIMVEFAGQTKITTTTPLGTWSLKLDPMSASSEGRMMAVRGNNAVTFDDVLVGEVWLASGQSNMGVPVSGAHNAATELPKAEDSQLRFFTVTKNTAAEAQTDLRGKWDLSTPETAKAFSAVAYFYARELRAKLKCPVGILHSSWGGTPAQAWVSLSALRKQASLAAHLKTWDAALAKYHEVQAHPEIMTAYQADLKQWQTDVAPAFTAAMKEYLASKSAGPKPVPSRPEPSNPDPMGIPSPSARPSTPSVIFNAMIAPLAPYAIRGAIWYQGEANGGAGLEYRTLLPCLIADWRAQWNQGDFTFLFVQLPGWDHDTKPVEQHDWPWLREAQLFTLKNVPRTGMAVTIDIGDPRNVHPTDKIDVGQRLALAARKVAYGEAIVFSGPLYRESAIESAAIRVKFNEIGGGLGIGQAPWRAEGVEPFPADKLTGFTIAGEDHQWVEATAVVDGDSVVVTSPKVIKPLAVRYGWANAPRCNLYNKEGLPASPFRTDDWPIPEARPSAKTE